MEKAPKYKNPEILEQYKVAFPDYTESYDIASSKTRVGEYFAFIKRTMANMKTLHKEVTKCIETKEKEMTDYNDAMQELIDYEKVALNEYTDGDEGKLILFNSANMALKERIDGVSTSMNNPYIIFDEWLEEEELDAEAVVEALNSLNKLEQNIVNLTKKIAGLDKEIQKLSSGNAEAKRAAVEKDRNQNQENLDNLTLISNMAYFNMENFFVAYKEEKAYNYYKAIKIYALIHKSNDMYNNSIWSEIKGILPEVPEEQPAQEAQDQ